MEKIVIPMIDDKFITERAKDELPQSSGGKMIMTTEPKFVPEEAVNVVFEDNMSFNVRMIDCVGYTVPGAVGYEDEDGPRMVTTPWYEHEIPFQEAAEVGTQKVIKEHSTIGLLITTDGSFSEISRHNFVMAEERVVDELKIINKPFIMALNSNHPESKETQNLCDKLSGKYDVPVIAVDCLNLKRSDIYNIMKKILYEFPLQELYIDLPEWINSLEKKHWLRSSYNNCVRNAVQDVEKIRDVYTMIDNIADNDYTREVFLREIDLGEGIAKVDIGIQEKLFYNVIEETCNQ